MHNGIDKGGIVLREILFPTLIILASIAVPIANSEYIRGVHIVVSFPNLVEDLKPLLCSSDDITYIAPPGSDPHEYSLTPNNVDDLKRADIIISTAHAPFEVRIRELRDQGVISGVLVEIPRIPGIVIKKNPLLGTPNYHMPIYDPDNYIVFINYIVEILSKLNPGCSSYYHEKAIAIINQIESIKRKTPHLNLSAVADTPVTQYAVEWTGIRIEYLVVKEHGVEVTPNDLAKIDKALAENTVDLVVVTYPIKTRYSMWLIQHAKTYGKPILYVLTPTSLKPVYAKLENISIQVREIVKDLASINSEDNHFATQVSPVKRRLFGILSFSTGLLLYSLLIYVLVRRIE